MWTIEQAIDFPGMSEEDRQRLVGELAELRRIKAAWERLRVLTRDWGYDHRRALLPAHIREEVNGIASGRIAVRPARQVATVAEREG